MTKESIVPQTIKLNNAYAPGLIIKGALSQTANLQEWQASDGTVYGRFNAFGSLYVSNNTESGTAQFGNTGFASASSVVLKVKGFASQTANLQEWQDSNGTALVRVTSSGVLGTSFGVYSPYYQGHNGVGGVIAFANATAITITPQSASVASLIVKGFASQSANLTEWHNSDGVVLSSFGPNGTINIKSVGGSNLATFYNGTNGYGAGSITSGGTFNINGANIGFPYTSSGAMLSVNATSATGVPITSRGYASQTANLQEWQNSAGTVLAAISSSGVLKVQNIVDQNNSGATFQFSSTSINAYTFNPATTPFTVNGAASQTADLQQWKNSAGTALAVVSNVGTVRASIFANLTGSLSYIATNFDTSGIGIVISSAAQKGLIVRGADSQTADLQQWQNSAGTVLALVDAYGRLGINTTSLANSTGGYSMVSIYNNNTVNTNLVIKSYPSQTATLTEWQNSSGTTLAKIDVLGNFTATSKSFDIEHPTKENMRLRYGSLEGPENGVYVRGTVESNVVELPDYWTELVHEDSITVSLTAVGSAQNIYVEKIENNKIYIGGNFEKAFFTVYGEHKDIDRLTVEY